LGLSGVSSDVRDIQEEALNGNERAQLALDVFTYRCRKYVGAYAAAMGGIDTLVFAGGIGQNAPAIRAQICTGLECLGLVLDEDLNLACEGKAGLISTPDSPGQVVVVVVDEELVIAQDTVAVLSSA
jgi:acetate kinase